MMYFILGYKNSGKTTLGKKLANKLDIGFIDLDSHIEDRENRKVTEIFSEDGENIFRQKESEALIDICQNQSDIVVSTGGSTPCWHDNMELMKKTGKTIYLKMDSDILVSRLSKVTKDRPIVKGKSFEELKEFVKTRREKYEHFYMDADYVIEGRNLKPDDIIKELFSQTDIAQ